VDGPKLNEPRNDGLVEYSVSGVMDAISRGEGRDSLECEANEDE
jgi:hypothetical protein